PAIVLPEDELSFGACTTLRMARPQVKPLAASSRARPAQQLVAAGGAWRSPAKEKGRPRHRDRPFIRSAAGEPAAERASALLLDLGPLDVVFPIVHLLLEQGLALIRRGDERVATIEREELDRLRLLQDLLEVGVDLVDDRPRGL